MSRRNGSRQILASWVLVLASSYSVGAPWSRNVVRTHRLPTKSRIPFALYHDYLIIVKATLGPLRDANFILDTGTSPSAITKQSADQLQLSGATEALQTLNGPTEAQCVILPHLQIGSIHADSLRVLIVDLGFLERDLGIPLAGIAGMDVLGRTNFTIDYRKRQIDFGTVLTNAKTVPFERQAQLLAVQAHIGGQGVRLVVDSGTSSLLTCRDRFRNAQPQKTLDPRSVSTVNGESRTRTFRAAISLGDKNLGIHDVVIADVDSDPQNHFDGLLGLTKMGFRQVSFDFEHGLLGWE